MKKILAALIAASFALAASSHAAVVDPAEPPATPAGGAPEAGLTAGAVVGGAILVGIIVAVAGGDDGDGVASTASGSGTASQ
jgi:hypothetical protein